MKLSLIIQGIDRLTAPARKAEKAARGLGKEIKATGAEGTRTSRTLDALGRGAGSAAYGIGFLTGRVVRLAGQGGLLALRKSAALTKSALIGTVGLAGRVVTGAAVAGIAAGGLFASTMLGISGRFEQFQVQLEGVLGSAAKAKAAMKWVRQFAQETPYEVEQVTEAFVRARGVGIDPMSGAMRKMGDAASGNNKTLMDAVEAIADAQTGEYERLKEFLITSSTKGNQVKFSYLTKAGKSASKTVRKDMAAIREAVLQIFDERNGGGMMRQSRTLFGIWNNIKDVAAGFQLDIANAGIFDFVKGRLQALLDKINELKATGQLDRWAKSISKWMVEAGKGLEKFLLQTNWKEVGETLMGVGRAAWFIARGIAAVVRLVDKFANGIKFLANNRLTFHGWEPIAIPRQPAGGAITAGRGQSIRRAGAGNVSVGGSVDIRIQASPGLRASVAGSTNTNRDVPLRINRGRSMAVAG